MLEEETAEQKRIDDEATAKIAEKARAKELKESNEREKKEEKKREKEEKAAASLSSSSSSSSSPSSKNDPTKQGIDVWMGGIKQSPHFLVEASSAKLSISSLLQR